tara:strand:- start:104 stop:826 length:723 start_codon:yes stop_codon:yes gene_type:complete
MPPIKKRKKKSKMYFGQPCQDAILEYLACDEEKEKNKIFRERIEYPFMKLAENLIHTFKFYNFDYDSKTVQKEVVGFMVLNMHKFNPDKGKAFSYFSIVAKNYLILNNNGNYKRWKQHKDISLRSTQAEMPNIDSSHDDLELSEFIDTIIVYIENNFHNIFRKKRDIRIADAILTLFKKRDYIENFNKKALYILIREMTDANTQQITKVVNTLKKEYVKLNKAYENNGIIETKNTGSLVF